MTTHACEWEVFDIDAAGCLLCGKIHRCDADVCSTVKTEDAEVCEITGCCVRDKLYAETEYSDTVASYNFGTDIHVPSAGVEHATIKRYVQQLLVSDESLAAYNREVQRIRTKIQMYIQQRLRTEKPQMTNLIVVLEDALQVVQSNRTLQQQYDRQFRETVARKCEDYICVIINMCMHYFKMPTRASEIRILVFGLMYLMRVGVVVYDIQVIPCVAELAYLLPAENTLHAFGFRPKFITDTENKFKYMLRSMPMEKLSLLGSQL